MRTLGAEGGVVAVPGVDPRLVGKCVEDLLRHVIDQRLEVLRTRGAPDAAWEQAVAGKDVRPVRPRVDERDRPGGVPDEVDDRQRAVAEAHLVAVLERATDRHRQLTCVGWMREDRRAGRRYHLR